MNRVIQLGCPCFDLKSNPFESFLLEELAIPIRTPWFKFSGLIVSYCETPSVAVKEEWTIILSAFIGSVPICISEFLKYIALIENHFKGFF